MTLQRGDALRVLLLQVRELLRDAPVERVLELRHLAGHLVTASMVENRSMPTCGGEHRCVSSGNSDTRPLLHVE